MHLWKAHMLLSEGALAAQHAISTSIPELRKLCAEKALAAGEKAKMALDELQRFAEAMQRGDSSER